MLFNSNEATECQELTSLPMRAGNAQACLRSYPLRMVADPGCCFLHRGGWRVGGVVAALGVQVGPVGCILSPGGARGGFGEQVVQWLGVLGNWWEGTCAEESDAGI